MKASALRRVYPASSVNSTARATPPFVRIASPIASALLPAGLASGICQVRGVKAAIENAQLGVAAGPEVDTVQSA
jgi:hypothetical protein